MTIARIMAGMAMATATIARNQIPIVTAAVAVDTTIAKAIGTAGTVTIAIFIILASLAD